MLSAILLIVLGLLAIPSLILKKKPNAKELFDKVAPYQGWFGLIWAVWGIIDLIRCLLNVNLIGVAPVVWILWLVISLVTACLGFILGYSLISKYALSKNEKTAAAGEKVLAKLLPLQGTMGIIAIVIGVLAIIGYIVM